MAVGSGTLFSRDMEQYLRHSVEYWQQLIAKNNEIVRLEVAYKALTARLDSNLVQRVFHFVCCHPYCHVCEDRRVQKYGRRMWPKGVPPLPEELARRIRHTGWSDDDFECNYKM